MKILIFEWNNFGIEDIKEAFDNMGHSYKCISSSLIHERSSKEFDELFEQEYNNTYDCVFTFNYSPIISNNCNKRNIPYIAFIYDSPLVALYSYTLINPCNYIFIFDKELYSEFKSANVPTVYYAPLAVNVSRLDRQLTDVKPLPHNCQVSFVGSMYNEKHNLFDRLTNLSEFTRGYLDAIIAAQIKVYGYYFIQDMLTPNIMADLQKSYPLKTNSDGIESPEYIYAYYFIARKIAELERAELLGAVSSQFSTLLFTPNPTPELTHIHNMGAIDYYNDMPRIFAKSPVNLNISLRSIRSGIPLRAMDIMGAGGFLLSNFQADFYDCFTPGEDMVMYESKDDMLNKCSYFLSHDKERMQIALNGYGKIKENNTYEIRLKEIFNIVFN